MQISFDEAVRLYEDLEPELKIPSQHPNYLLIDSERENGLEPTFFAFLEDGEIYYHAYHMSQVPETPYYDVQSPYGYGGAVSTTTNQDFLKRAWSSYQNWCSQNNVLAEFVRFHPFVQNWRFYQGEALFDRETVWIDLKQEDLLSGYQSRTRNTLRKATKSGVTVGWCDQKEFFRWFPSLYEDLMKKLDASHFYFFPHEYYQAWSTSDYGHYAICQKEGEIVAAAVFYHFGQIMEYHLSASNEIGKRYAANTLLIHEAGMRGKLLNCKYLHLGGGTNHLPDNPLFAFKAGFSDHRSDYYIGKYIHLPKEYEKVKAEWESQNGKASNRILFYR